MTKISALSSQPENIILHIYNIEYLRYFQDLGSIEFFKLRVCGLHDYPILKVDNPTWLKTIENLSGVLSFQQHVFLL